VALVILTIICMKAARETPWFFAGGAEGARHDQLKLSGIRIAAGQYSEDD
jgi:hypothetical protein